MFLAGLHAVGADRPDALRRVDLVPLRAGDLASSRGHQDRKETALPNWHRRPPATRIELVRRAVGRAREAPRQSVPMRNPEILREAAAAKLDELTRAR